MKNNILLGILSIAVIILYILHFCGGKEEQKAPAKSESKTPVIAKESKTDTAQISKASSTIAYVNMDTLLEKYTFAKDVNAQLLKREKDASAKLNDKSEKLRKDYAKVEEKYRKGLMTQMEAQSESEKLVKQQQEIQNLDNSLSKNLLEEQKKFNKQLQDTILKFFKEYNADKHYSAIFSNANNDNIIYADKQLNITDEVIDILNKRYKASKK